MQQPMVLFKKTSFVKKIKSFFDDILVRWGANTIDSGTRAIKIYDKKMDNFNHK